MFGFYEQKLREQLMRADTPVLGILGPLVPSEAKAAIQRDLQVMPSARGFVRRLDEYPALFGVWLAEHVMFGLGQDGHFSLYPHIQKAIGGVKELSLTDRELLWRAFRRAILKLGIKPLPRRSGSHYMVDEYVRQAGVPIAFADDLASRMLQVARRVGLPDEDDHDGILTWQAQLINKLLPPFSITARKALERDTVGYYTRTFIRIHQNGGHASEHDVLGKALASAFLSSNSSPVKRAIIPHLLYRDGLLGILFPPSSSASRYQIESDKFSFSVEVEAQGTFRVLPVGLPSEVRVIREDGEQVLFAKLWPDSLSNRLLVFSSDGRLRLSAKLNQDEPVELAPGNYTALCRFEPTNREDGMETCEHPLLVEVPLEVRPGSEQQLQNGPASVCIVGENQPTFSLSGASKGSLERQEFWFGSLEVLVEVPQEWLEHGPRSFEMRIGHGDNQVALPVSLDESRHARVSLDIAIAELGILPGVRRLVVELALRGDLRTLQRQSILYWTGLQQVKYDYHFVCESPPQNLITSGCSGIKITRSGVQVVDGGSRIIRMTFDLGAGRIVRLSWHRAGVFVETQVSTSGGSSTIIARPLGATETVSLGSTKTVVISASEPGFITLGSMRIFVDFARRASKTFPASLLASRLEPGARTLTYESSSGLVTLPLLVLSQPHIVTDVKVERVTRLFEIRVTLNGEPTDVSVTGRELNSGREARAEYKLMAGTWHDSGFGRMQVFSAPSGSSYVLHVQIDIQSLMPGVWIFGFGACMDGIWGRLQDAEDGRIAVAFSVDEQRRELPDKQINEKCSSLGLDDVVARLSRLNEHFIQYWSPICWEQQSWLVSYHLALLNKLKGHEDAYLTQLLDMAMAQPEDDIRAGHIPIQFSPAWLNRIFIQPSSAYTRVNIKPHPLSFSLRAMAALRGAISPAFGAVLHPTAAMAFRNRVEVMKGRRPKGFELAAYREVLRQTALEGGYRLDDELFLPNDGELLGPLHIAHAWIDLERRYQASQLLQNNHTRAAFAVARILQRRDKVFTQSAPLGLRGQPLLLQVDAKESGQIDEVEQLKREHMEHIAHACAWFAWYCRLEVRSPGKLLGFQLHLAELRNQVEIPGPEVSDCLSYYLQVAPAIFSFYLLLWELVLTVEFDPIVQNV